MLQEFMSDHARKTLDSPYGRLTRYSIRAIEALGMPVVETLPYSIRVLVENVLRNADLGVADEDHLRLAASWRPKFQPSSEFPYMPSRVLLQDFTGVPVVTDLAAMRDAVATAGGDPSIINPVTPSDMVIDHSVQVDYFASADAMERNIQFEFSRNRERYQLLKWAQEAFDNLRIIPPGVGIVHQVNLESIATVAMLSPADSSDHRGRKVYPDTCIGTDSHTTMVNGMGVLGWGVGGIEAEAVMLGQPYYMLFPEVIGVRLLGKLPKGSTSTDLVLSVTEMLRQVGVVEKFVEFYGPGLAGLTIPDRATIANMAPEYGATCGFFPVDEQTIHYLSMTGRSADAVELTEHYAKVNGFWHAPSEEPEYSATVEFNLGEVEPSLAGPRRPQDRLRLSEVASDFAEKFPTNNPAASPLSQRNGDELTLEDGSVVVAAITSCTNTSNPSVMIGAGLLARKAYALGLRSQPWVKTSMAPGSRVVAQYLERSGLQKDLDALGFNIVGYGCTTCIGNSGPLPQKVSRAIDENQTIAAAVLSGNRNFEGRIHPQVRANYLASPMLVTAYAIAGSVNIDLAKDPLGVSNEGREVFLRDIWPAQDEIAECIAQSIDSEMFLQEYSDEAKVPSEWRDLSAPVGERFGWDKASTYIQPPPYFDDFTTTPSPVKSIKQARVLVSLGNTVTTDHISPAGSIPPTSPAGQSLVAADVPRVQFNSYGSRRGNHNIMMRGTFGNIRLSNKLAGGDVGDWTVHYPSGDKMRIFDAAIRYMDERVPLIVLAGKEYGTGSSRDWAAKGPMLLGVRAVIAESYERIHRSNLVGMGVLPLQFVEGDTAETLGIEGTEQFDLEGVTPEGVTPGAVLGVTCTKDDGTTIVFDTKARVDTAIESEYIRHGGLLPYVLRKMMDWN